ncbi:UDP-glucose 4-epimerase, partial [bacterium]|nr:UDP-glucose 4-epimerase [bacterium]
LEAALGKREEVSIFGTDYPTRDGTCIRDYIHVCDLAEAHLLTLEWMMEHDASNDFNLGNGKGFTVKEVIDVARRVTNREIQTRETHRRDGDAESLIGSSEKAKAVLGWIPKIDSLEEIVSSAWRWHRKVEDLGGEDPENG